MMSELCNGIAWIALLSLIYYSKAVQTPFRKLSFWIGKKIKAKISQFFVENLISLPTKWECLATLSLNHSIVIKKKV